MIKEKTKKEKSPKPKYNMGQNSAYMIKLAWTSGEKKVIVLSLLSALTAVALNLINLYVSPTILSVVERKGSITELIVTIAVFVGALMLVSAASSYVNTNTLYGRISVRCEIINALNRKAATTSYPNIYDEKFKKLKAKGFDAIVTTDGGNAAGSASSEIKVGDVVQFSGGPHYGSAAASTAAGSPKAGPAKVTRIVKGAKHPYHIVHTDNQSNVYGWVDAANVSK